MREKLICKDPVTPRRHNVKLWKDRNQSLKTLSTSPHGGLRIRTWLLAILGALVMSLIIINTLITGQFGVTHLINTTQDKYIDNESQLMNVQNKKDGFLVRNNGCRITAFDPLDSFSKRFMKTEVPIQCEFGSQLPLVESNETHIFVNRHAINQYYNTTEMPSCCWREFRRKENNDNQITMDNVCHPFQNSTRILAEFIRVECWREEVRIYRDYYFFMHRKPEVELRCRTASKHNDQKELDPIEVANLRKLSLLVLGLDSVSRLNFHRMMPKTVKTLESLSAIEMLGYNKVGDNTYPNIVPVLTGLSEKELQTTCWNETSKPFDDCPFMWKNFSTSGYRTIFAEDACSITTFNYLKPGFYRQPTDYYLRPYCVAAENDIGNTRKLNTHLCLGTRKNFENFLTHSSKVARTFSKDPYFAFFWQASLTHDFFNYPQLGDDAYSKAIHQFYQEGIMENTALIVMSDHGMRWGEFRQTYQGRMEGSLPFVFMVLPKWWREKYPIAFANLRKNAESLTTPYDLHETLTDLLKPELVEEERIKKRTKIINWFDDKKLLPRGISWFLPIPESRTCDLAGIPGHWCMCHTSNDFEIGHESVKNTTAFLIEELNSMLRKYPQCAVLRINRIKDAKMWKHTETDGNDPWVDLTVTIETLPGNAVFEASIRHGTDGINKLIGSISRLNAYGSQSACVNDFNMRLYCYCE
uniref:FRYL_0 protein n=1 Tax=Fopius arisanus TaxID=64838 RepID=A0A0C9RZ88_9HYME